MRDTSSLFSRSRFLRVEPSRISSKRTSPRFTETSSPRMRRPSSITTTSAAAGEAPARTAMATPKRMIRFITTSPSPA